MILAEPLVVDPEVAKVTPSFVQAIEMESPNWDKSRAIC